MLLRAISIPMQMTTNAAATTNPLFVIAWPTPLFGLPRITSRIGRRGAPATCHIALTTGSLSSNIGIANASRPSGAIAINAM